MPYAISIIAGERGVAASLAALETSTSIRAVGRIRGDTLLNVADGTTKAILCIADPDNIAQVRIQWHVTRSGDTLKIVSNAADFGSMSDTGASLDRTTLSPTAFYRIYLSYAVSPANEYVAGISDDAGSPMYENNSSSFGVSLGNANAGWGGVILNQTVVQTGVDVVWDWLAVYTAGATSGHRYDTPTTGDANIVELFPYDEGVDLTASNAIAGAPFMELDGDTTWIDLSGGSSADNLHILRRRRRR